MGKINVAELLKDCPKGMELDCTIYDSVEFMEVDTESDTIILRIGNKFIRRLNKYGQDDIVDYAKCVIFPKGKTTWEGFHRPWTIQDAKDGDVIFYDDGWTCIFKRIHGIWYSSYCFITSDGEFHTGYEEHAVDSTINGNARLATKEQCNLLFQKIKEAGYKWNPKTKTLEKLPKFKVGNRIKNGKNIATIVGIYEDFYDVRFDSSGGIGSFTIDLQDEWELFPNKFDITTLKPFDKVLVREDNKKLWRIQFFEKLNNVFKDAFVCMGGYRCHQCIPYEGNEHLLDTSNEPDDFYKTWQKLNNR